MKRLQHDEREVLSRGEHLPRKSAKASPTARHIAEPARVRRRLPDQGFEVLGREEVRGDKFPGGVNPGELQRAFNNIVPRTKHRNHRVPKAVFEHSDVSRVFHGVGSGFVLELCVEGGHKGIGKFGEASVRALRNAAPVQKVGKHGEQNENKSENQAVPEGEAHADRIKHAIFSVSEGWGVCLATAPWYPADRREYNRCRVAFGEAACRHPRRVCAAGGLRRPR
jgi:hypothetical protein